MTRLALGADCSNWGGPLNKPQALKDFGVEFLIPGTQTGNDGKRYTEQQTQAARSVGITVNELYGWLTWTRDIPTQVAYHLQIAESIGGIERLWLDCEDAVGSFTPYQILTKIDAAIEACGDMPCGIYTGAWWWPGATGNSDDYNQLPLWHAAYQGRPTDLTLPWPYGGWTAATVWQFHDTTSAGGFSVDLNVREVENEAPPVPNFTPEQIKLALYESEHRVFKALVNQVIVAVPGPTPTTVEFHQVIDGKGQPFVPPVVLEVGA